MSTVASPIPTRHSLPAVPRVLRGAGIAVLWLLGGILVCIAALPVALLFVITAVPRPLALVLVAADIALIVAFVRFERTALAVTAFVLGVIAVSMVAVWMSQVYAYTPPILGADGKPLAGSIAVMERVPLNGTEQWVTIRGKDTTKPILLFLAGGPGGSELPFTRNVLGGLEDHFVVVNWDQPGAGKSYGVRRGAELTVEQFVADGRALSDLLRARFHQDKIYLMGESWGTVLGVKLVQQYPDLFYAYIGAGQRTSCHEDDVLGYQLALKIASERGDTALVEKLEGNGVPPYDGWNMAFKNTDYLNVLNGYSRQQAHAEPTGHDLMSDAITGYEYGLLDRVNWFRGLVEGFTVIYPQLDAVDFNTQATKLDVPVYFLQGDWDLVELGSLLDRWYARLDAPRKEIILFENSGHTPHSWQPTRVVDVIVNHVLAETPPTK